MTTSEQMVRTELLIDVEQFIAYELQLLDEHQYSAWVDLFADDGIYWVPSNSDDYDPARHVSIIYNDKPGLLKRVARLDKGRAVQEVRSRVAHQFSNTLVLDERGDEITVRVVMVVYEVQRARKNYYPGSCIYRLRRSGTGWRIVLKKLCLIDNDQFYEHLAFMI
jgi:benzoate/toluate 1,2-dioxygenase beta subunit